MQINHWTHIMATGAVFYNSHITSPMQINPRITIVISSAILNGVIVLHIIIDSRRNYDRNMQTLSGLYSWIAYLRLHICRQNDGKAPVGHPPRKS